MKKFFNVLIMILFLASILTGCRKDKGDPPALPPGNSFTIDFSIFEPGKKSTATDFNIKGIEDSHWEFAAVVSGYFRTLLTTTLAVPVLAFQKALDQSPVYLEEKTWQWSYSFSLLSVTYKARLTGQILTDDIEWNMYISREGSGGFPEFLWFDGLSKLDGARGTWNLRQSYDYNKPLLKIEWTRTGNSVNYIKYTYVRTTDNNGDSDPNNSSYIEYGRTTGTYDSFYNISYFNGLIFAQVNVEWNSTSRIGRVKCPAFYGDNNWYCWDGTLSNSECP
jgi:hypothetical protein